MCMYYAALFYLAVHAAAPREGEWDFEPAGAGVDKVVGRILAVTETSVMIGKTGAKKNEVVTYPFHHRLRGGSYNQLEGEGLSYKRDDLKVGDIVLLRILKLDQKIDFCVSISIRQRPGGKLPPSAKYRLGDWRPYHEKMNALDALDFSQIPLPRHLTLEAKPYEYPAFDTDVPRKERIKPWPSSAPFTYIEYALFLR